MYKNFTHSWYENTEEEIIQKICEILWINKERLKKRLKLNKII